MSEAPKRQLADIFISIRVYVLFNANSSEESVVIVGSHVSDSTVSFRIEGLAATARCIELCRSSSLQTR